MNRHKEDLKMLYYTVVGDEGKTCGHKHRHYGRAVDCFDKWVDSGNYDDEPEIVAVANKAIDFEYVTGWREKYGYELNPDMRIPEAMQILYPN